LQVMVSLLGRRQNLRSGLFGVDCARLCH
jgi:hypothetical protein